MPLHSFDLSFIIVEMLLILLPLLERLASYAVVMDYGYFFSFYGEGCFSCGREG